MTAAPRIPLAPVAKARVLEGLTAAAYHADPCARPSLSASCATTLLTRSPYHAWLEHPRLGAVRARDHAERMDAGTVLHALLLEGGAGLARDRRGGLPRGEGARGARRGARGRRDARARAGPRGGGRARRRRARAARERGASSSTGDSEVSVEWTEHAAGGDAVRVSRAARPPDRPADASATMLDFKRTHCAAPSAASRSAWDHGYDVQREAYGRAVEALHPHLVGRADFQFVFIEELPEGAPRRALLTVARPDGMFREVGARRWTRAVDRWARCLASDSWSGYPAGTVALECPAWARIEEEL
jgi:hypothetical protein